jgi:hypothetical protein
MAGEKDAEMWRSAVAHSVRTAVAAGISVLTARLFHLPQSYWDGEGISIIWRSSSQLSLGPLRCA